MKTVTIFAVVIFSALAAQAADITGTWTANVTLDAGSGTATFTLKQTGEALSGTYAGTFGEAKVAGTVKGDRVEWSFEADQAGKVVFTGAVDGAAKMKGTCVYGQLGKGTFTAEKK